VGGIYTVIRSKVPAMMKEFNQALQAGVCEGVGGEVKHYIHQVVQVFGFVGEEHQQRLREITKIAWHQ